jgi:SAM-dependent methyltransferase/uncharacterized protein YbaR (Trm112 family)
MTADPIQTGVQRRGEVHFRSFHKDYVDAHLPLARRMIEFRQDFFAHLAFDGGPMSPYLEIGAELCLNGMILENRIGATGVAADLSRDALAVADAYRERLGMGRLPLRVCCDAYRLPFRGDVFPLVLGWGTFHHFPDPTPIFREARRVLHPDGRFVFGEEPVRRRLSLNLYNTRTPPDFTRVEALLMRLGLLPYLAVLGGRMEIERGILEGTFREADLRRHLSVFDEVALTFNPQLTGGIPSAGRLVRGLLGKIVPADRAARIATRWFGGAVAGRCRKHERGLRAGEGVAVTAEGGWRIAGRGIVLAKRAPVHDRVGIVLTGENAAVAIDGVPVPEAACVGSGNRIMIGAGIVGEASRDVLSIEIRSAPGVGLETVFFESSTHPGSYYAHRPIPDPPAAFDPERMLGCPDCVTVGASCVAEKCNRPCAAAAAGEVDFAGGRARIAPGKGLAALTACPFKCIDRSPLVRAGDEYRCMNCGRRYPIQDGVLTLLPAVVETELYG